MSDRPSGGDRGTGVPLTTYRYTTQCPAPQILDLHYNTTPPQLLSLPVCQCTGAPADSLMLSAICSKSQGHAIWSRLSQGLVGWVSQLVMGCVTCHTCHGCVTDFRPILGNIVEVTLMTSPILYIVSHAKGTSFP